MHRAWLTWLVSLTALTSLAASTVEPPPAAWPSFRGPDGTGFAANAHPPASWNVATGQNVRWTVAMDGFAHSSPIASGKRLFVTTAVSEVSAPVFKAGYTGSGEPAVETTRHAWRIHALDVATGRTLWTRTAREGVPRTQRHVKSSQASSSPVTDGRVVVAFFGSEGLHAWDIDGRPLWQQDLGALDSGSIHYPERQWGVASSPVIAGDVVIVQVDVQRGSFIAAFDVRTGRRVWTTARDEIPSWASPVVAETEAGRLVIANGGRFIRGYDVATGAERWRATHGSDIVVPTPVVAAEHGLAIVMSGYQPTRPIIALRLGARGDISLAEGEDASAHVAWSRRRGGAYIPSPVVADGRLYVLGSNGVLAGYDVASGRQLYEERVAGRGGAYSASPVAADGRLYIASEDGEIHVLALGDRYELLGTCDMGEAIMATPALVGDLLVVRGVRRLFGLGTPAAAR